MNKTKSINRLFLGMILWAVLAPLFLQRILMMMSTEQSMVAGEVLFTIPVVVYLLTRRIRIREWIPFRKTGISTILMSALAGFLLLPLVTFINLFSMMFATNYVSQSSVQLVENPLWLNLLIVAAIPAVVEELTYRGIFYHAYREKGVIPGTIASAIVFGIMHRNLNQFFYALVLGIIFCMLVEITGSIYASMTAHFVINGWSVLLLAVQKPLQDLAGMGGDMQAAQSELTNEMLLMALGVYGVFALIGTASATGVMIWLTKHCKREAHMRWCFRRHALPEGVKRSFVTPSFVIALVLAVGYMILLEIV
ncbi:MAG: lysostaphin resistance A-like protein [Hominisplanchenecus sp.]